MNYAGFIYEWTNTINGKKYIGSHLGREDDGYIGSGQAFRKELKQYGLVSFTRKILEHVVDAQDLADVEKQWLEKVNAKDNDLYYNKTNGSSVSKKPRDLPTRGLCKTCNTNPVAVNYTDTNNRVHYRSQCDNCIRKGKKIRSAPPLWVKRGYRKKPQCEQCGFKFKFPDQSLVYHVDGNLNNCDHNNLKTVCLNCRAEISRSRLPWKQSKIVPDF